MRRATVLMLLVLLLSIGSAVAQIKDASQSDDPATPPSEETGDAGGTVPCNCCNAGGLGTPGCDCQECEDAVCAFDAFCCNTSWDSICSSEALTICTCCTDGCTGDGDGGGDDGGDDGGSPGGAFCSNPNLPILDSSTTSDSIVVSGVGGSVSDLEVSVQIQHTFVGDLSAVLSSPSSAATLIDRPGVPTTTFGCGGDDVDAVLSDSGGSSVEDACSAAPPAIGGVLAPFPDALGSFDGEDPNGIWTLSVSDSAQADQGTFLGWCLDFGGGGDGGGDDGGDDGGVDVCNCCSGGNTVGCDCPACETVVCEIDTFCCDVSWDDQCDGEAATLCGCCNDGCQDGDNVNAYLDLKDLDSELEDEGCAPGTVATMTIDAEFVNNSPIALSDLFAETLILTNGNVVCNADGGPPGFGVGTGDGGGAGGIGVGAIVTVPHAGEYADNLLTPGEAFDVTFVIGMTSEQPFDFFINVFGTLIPVLAPARQELAGAGAGVGVTEMGSGAGDPRDLGSGTQSFERLPLAPSFKLQVAPREERRDKRQQLGTRSDSLQRRSSEPKSDRVSVPRAGRQGR